jgi:hypothetical protein
MRQKLLLSSHQLPLLMKPHLLLRLPLLRKHLLQLHLMRLLLMRLPQFLHLHQQLLQLTQRRPLKP